MYNSSYDLYIVVGIEQNLQDILIENTEAMITDDLRWFYIGTITVNLILFGLAAGLLEKQLSKKILTPIMNLTKQIKDPKKFFNNNQNLA